jgi:hypothetical protein
MKSNIGNFCVVFSHFVLRSYYQQLQQQELRDHFLHILWWSIVIIIIVIILFVCPAPSLRRSFLQAVLLPGWLSAQSCYGIGCTDCDMRNPLHTPTSYLPCIPSSLSSLAWNFYSFYPCVDTVSLLRHQVKWYIIGIFPDVAISLLLDRTVYRAPQWHGAQTGIISH